MVKKRSTNILKVIVRESDRIPKAIVGRSGDGDYACFHVPERVHPNVHNTINLFHITIQSIFVHFHF